MGEDAAAADADEREQRAGFARNDVKSSPNRAVKSVDRLDHVIGCRHAEHGILVALKQHRRGKADRICGVAPSRLMFRLELRQVRENRVAMLRASADKNSVRRNDAGQSVEAELKQALSLDDGKKLLGHVAS